MILNCEQLYMVTQNPRINDISLELLREYYELYLNPYIYKYKIINNKKDKKVVTNIELRFDKNNFCHLLGIENTLRHSVNKEDLFTYVGQAGWDNIKNEILDFKFIKGKNKLGFNNNKSRYVFFYLIPKLVDHPKGILYDASKVMGLTLVDCELLFYDEYQNAYIHIGIKEDKDLGYYIPKTFLIEKITEHSDGRKYINKQDKIIVTSKKGLIN
ncbi:MAG: hypothetical protein JJE21_10315 [Spirochaetaceae bacterium]|nr:hypothetical protein [Spirochaetaceae bacterium]